MNSRVNKTLPTNLISEREKFFSDVRYNPQFTYPEETSPAELAQWGLPKPELVVKAKQLLDKHGFAETVPIDTSITEETVLRMVQQMLHQLGISDLLTVHFQKHKVTRATITSRDITFKSPPRYKGIEDLEGSLNHEIQTHLLRSINQARQGWLINKEQEMELRRTEEGLAVLHAQLPKRNVFIRKPLLNYFAIDLAQRHSFAECFDILVREGLSESKAWDLVLRVKRGLTNTSLPGGMTKDVIYLEGFVYITPWMLNRTNNPKDLYLGKIGLSEVEEKKKLATASDIIYPTFFKDITVYSQRIQYIIEENGLAEIAQKVR
jgi:hypothetical protein